MTFCLALGAASALDGADEASRGLLARVASGGAAAALLGIAVLAIPSSIARFGVADAAAGLAQTRLQVGLTHAGLVLAAVAGVAPFAHHAVRWPTGRKRLQISYTPPELASGTPVSCGTLLTALALVGWQGRKLRSPRVKRANAHLIGHLSDGRPE
jgi:hypothetical protein